MLCSMKAKVLSLAISGLLLASIGLTLYLIYPAILDNQIRERLILKEGSETYKYWKDTPVPIYIEFYFFNVTNPEEVYELKEPVIEELGPYTFREAREKVNITWNENGTVSYRQVKRWHFQPDKTVGSLQDLITTLNVPMVAASAKGKQLNEPMIYFAIETLFEELNFTWLINRTVEELLFKGYEDELLKYSDPFTKIPYDRFGWFYKKNNTDDGEYVVYTGKDDIDSVDQVRTWNNKKSLSSYAPPCNLVKGSAGDIWPPGLTKKFRPTMFVPDICRSLSFTYLQEVEMQGVRIFRYWADEKELDNGKYKPENKCFCNDDGSCLPAGGVNISTCKSDAPAVVSYPHFLFADSVYSQGVIGMKPNPHEHRMYLDIIPELGIPVAVAARMQINIVFERVKEIPQFQNITRRTYFPMFWFSETAEAGTDIMDQLKVPLITLPLVFNIFSFIFAAVGSSFVLTAFVLSLLYASGKIEDKTRSQSNSTVGEGEKQKPDRGMKMEALLK